MRGFKKPILGLYANRHKTRVIQSQKPLLPAYSIFIATYNFLVLDTEENVGSIPSAPIKIISAIRKKDILWPNNKNKTGLRKQLERAAFFMPAIYSASRHSNTLHCF
jgi:hypothetical protein